MILRMSSSLRARTRYVRRHYYIFLLPIAIFLFGTLAYHVVEGMSILDSFYMTAITISTVGYREVKELSSSGKILTVFLIFATC